MLEINNIELREKLYEINTIINTDLHIKLIDEIRHEYNHKIRLSQKVSRQPKDLTKTDDDYYRNCYSYCFGIKFGDIKGYVNVREGYFDNNKLPNSIFVNYLIKNCLNEISLQEANEGDYVIYFSDTKSEHIGKFLEGKVVSKWGPNGHIWEHGIDEVPRGYGSIVKFYKKISKEKIFSLYNRWIKYNNS